MLSIETMKWRLGRTKGAEFPLVQWAGRARVLDVTDTSLDLLVAGRRADYTWERLARTWKRLRDNQTLGIDELGGAHDAVGIVSLFAFLEADSVDVVDDRGLLVFRRTTKRRENPVHQYADMSTPTAWPLWRSHIHGD